MIGTDHVDAQGRGPVFVTDLVPRHHINKHRIIDQGVDAPELLESLFHHGVDALATRHVGGDGQRLSAPLRDRLRHLLAGGGVDLGDDNTPSLRAEVLGVGLSDSVTAARDDDDWLIHSNAPPVPRFRARPQSPPPDQPPAGCRA